MDLRQIGSELGVDGFNAQLSQFSSRLSLLPLPAGCPHTPHTSDCPSSTLSYNLYV